MTFVQCLLFHKSFCNFRLLNLTAEFLNTLKDGILNKHKSIS